MTRLDGVTKRYGDVVALDGVTLEVADGFHCLVGPNGSGKSTLVRILLGLTSPSAGSVTVDCPIGVAFQQPSFYGDLTVAENLDVFGSFAGVESEWREEVVEGVGLTDVLDRPAGALSAGYEKKLDLALGLVTEPDLLLLDEPLADLDDATKARLVELLAAFADDHAVLAATHNLATFASVCDHLTVLQYGAIVLDEPRSSLPEDLRNAYLTAAGVE